MCNLRNKYGITIHLELITPVAFTNIFLQKLIYIAIRYLWEVMEIFKILYTNTETHTL